ncbi:MAG: T9SS type A sorting domain-containing protein [Nonlabens sp.]
MTAVIENYDGTYLVVSRSDSQISGSKTVNTKGGFDTWLIKIDAQGNRLWQKSIGGAGDDSPRAVVKTDDNGYVIFMTSNSGISGDKTEASQGLNDFWVVKVDAIGNIIWQNTIGGDGEDIARTALDKTLDGGYIIAGSTSSNISGDQTFAGKGLVDIWLIKLDSNGVLQWHNRIGGNDRDFVNAVKQTIDGGYIIGTFSYSDASGDKSENASNWNDYWIIKTDSTGNITWENTIGGDGTEVVSDLLQANNGNYVIAGYSNSNISVDKTENAIGNYDYWIMELDQMGSIVWQNTIGGTSRDDAWGIEKDGNDYIIAGQSMSRISGYKTETSRGWYDYWMVKIDDVGNVLWDKTLGGDGGDHLIKVEVSTNGYLLAGSSDSRSSGDKAQGSWGFDLWIIKLGPDQTASTSDRNKADISISPVPSNDNLFISAPFLTTAQLYDLQGRLVLETAFKEINLKGLKNSTYILKIYDSYKNLVKTSKVIKN